MEEEEELCIAKLFDVVKNKKKSNAKKKNKTKSEKAVTETVELKEAEAEDSARAVENNEDDDAVGVDDGDGDASSGGVRISQFDYSVDNYFHYLDTIARLCGENEDEDFEQSEIQRISSSVTFLRKWRDFQYPSRSIRFGYGPGSSEREDVNTINLPQFSSATVPTYDLQKENRLENAKSQESRDFVMYVGGPVWALDWCPQMHEKPDCSIKCEFIAVATHPPGSSYHKMGAPLTGRGVIQIWCLLNIREQNEDVFPLTEKRRKTTKKGGGTDDKSTQIKRPRGRPRKNPIQVPVDDMNCETQNVLPLDIKFPEDSAEFPTPDGNLEHNEKICSLTEKRENPPKKGGGKNDKSIQIKKPRGRPRKNSIEVPVDDMNCEAQNVLPLEVKFPEDSAELPTPDGNLEHNEVCSLTKKRKKRHEKGGVTNDKSTEINKPRLRPRKNPVKVPVDDINCETQDVLDFDVQFPEDSVEFYTTDGDSETSEEIFYTTTHKRKKGPKKNEATSEKSGQIQRPKGRSKQNSNEVIAVDTKCKNQSVQALAVQVLQDSAEFISPDLANGCCNKNASLQNSVAEQKHAKTAASACSTRSETPIKSRLINNFRKQSHIQDIGQTLVNEANHQPPCSSELGPLAGSHSIPAEVTLPRVVSCLAHNGKVAWDVKWRPPNMSDSLFKYRMGYLAVLLGNGSLEVWEVPLPRVLRAIYIHGEGNDPRFIKLQPVFKCSLLKRGGLQSIPLTLEWSVTPPHDYLLVGCHDGTVALWKFSKNASSKCDDTKPILCFGADTVPIRAVAWAPFDGDPESSNIIVTAGHERLKFWDLRNPFRPLRNLHAAPRIIYSLDWLSKPSCIIMSFEDGAMRTISLSQAANDLPVSGKIYTGKKQPGLHTTIYSSFAIWSVQVSRITGMVAYCGADGTVFRFQLTSKAVEKDNSPRNRAPSFLCGSVTEEESTLIISTPVSHDPFPLKSCERSRRPAESFRELLSKTNNQIAKASNSDSRTLALSNGDGLDLESESEEALSSREKPKRPKLIHSNKEKPVENQGLICRDDVSTSTPGVDNEESNLSNIPEVFPSKMVALHKVRWNMNKGSERWLCSGGAGGVVRCQKIVLSDIDRQWALKR
ncbi:PREDICTED: uncharacterized protein LOC109336019 isoform X2 [Lupinus angustifolius]|uniref:uncharacterized protein LOC109336019 isoform X1 n=1 Tax=Lupinus angustifolius TaxID=3871 RepID=UPI00092EDC73|nr:PREDICTED: uncharacterized protein LOC109336019 isoform X1 [Lupinus angustifolius]XP_019427891.1 PREDICTED: uncharacterized protein LOC109336019 isoform X2 [Lupinus angustifolius]